MVKMSFIPEERVSQFYTPVEVQFDLPNDAELSDYFKVFKSFCYSIGFTDIEDYVFMKEDDILAHFDNDENCGEIITKQDVDRIQFLINKTFFDDNNFINPKPKEGKDNDGTN